MIMANFSGGENMMLIHARKERKAGILSEEEFNESHNHLVIKVCLY